MPTPMPAGRWKNTMIAEGASVECSACEQVMMLTERSEATNCIAQLPPSIATARFVMECHQATFIGQPIPPLNWSQSARCAARRHKHYNQLYRQVMELFRQTQTFTQIQLASAIIFILHCTSHPVFSHAQKEVVVWRRDRTKALDFVLP